MLTLARLTLALVALAAIGWQLVLHVGASYSVLNFFSYFTNLSNLFAVLVLLLSVVSGGSARDLARYLSAVNMAVVGIVFAVLLRDVDLGALRPWVNVVLHIVMPVAVVLDWLLRPPTAALTAKHVRLALVFPALYLVYVLVRGAATGWYPYPFLDPAHVGGYGVVAAYAVGIFATFLLASWALLAVGNRSARKTHAGVWKARGEA
ncbi:MAG: Pr6Pr family membrane protein [Rubrivivax sp.]